MNDGYFEWLLNRAEVSSDEMGYSYLCSILYSIPFQVLVEMDENRWLDGMRYRDEYGNRAGLDDALEGCTVMELILSMAEKMYFETLDSRFEAPIGKWFEELISNLGLDIYTNRELMENEHAYFEAEGIIQKFVFRKYRWNGEGGLFPLLYPGRDQRLEELQIQMNNYLAENYDVLE